MSRPLPDASLTPLVVVPGAEMPLPHLTAALEQMGRCVYVLAMPPQKQMAQLRSVPALAALWVAAVRTRVPAGVPVLLAGIGAGGVVAHEMAVQLQLAGVPGLLPLEVLDPPDSALWQALFSADTPVAGFKYQDMSRVNLRSYAVRNVLGYVREHYGKLAVSTTDIGTAFQQGDTITGRNRLFEKRWRGAGGGTRIDVGWRLAGQHRQAE